MNTFFEPKMAQKWPNFPNSTLKNSEFGKKANKKLIKITASTFKVKALAVDFSYFSENSQKTKKMTSRNEPREPHGVLFYLSNADRSADVL